MENRELAYSEPRHMCSLEEGEDTAIVDYRSMTNRTWWRGERENGKENGGKEGE